MSNFKPLNTKKYIKSGNIVTPDTTYWKSLAAPTLIKDFSAIDYIDFSPDEPHCFAITCSVRVQIYHPITKLVVKNLTRFQETAYGGTFRQDGQLLVAGDEEGYVRLFDTSSANVLRFFRGHKAAVHRTQFTADLMHIASFSDDKTVKLWDIATEKAVHTFEQEHSDYIRAGATNPVDPNLIVSGGYDSKIKVYDTRTNEVTRCVDHGSPVESLLFLPTGGIFLSAGGTEVRVWDALTGFRLMAKMSQHHKTITCLRLGSNGKRILSGSLDHHVKIYDVATYNTVHTLNFPNAVLSLGLAANDQTVVAGMVDGLLSIQNMDVKRNNESETRKMLNKQKRIASFQYDNEVGDYEVSKDSKYNESLRKYEYNKCLKEVLRPYVATKTPEITVSVMQELIHRKGLHIAVSERNNAFLHRLVQFISRNITEARFMRVLTAVGMVLLDVYESKFYEFNADLGKLFISLSLVLKRTCALSYKLLELQGAIELLVDTSNLENTENDGIIEFVENEVKIFKPSAAAKDATVTVK